MEESEPKIAEMKSRLNEAFGDADDDTIEATDIDQDAEGEESESTGEGEEGVPPDNVTELRTEFGTALRMLEALLFAASEPLDEATLKDRLPTDIELPGLIAELQKQYENRGVHLTRVGARWQFRTASDLAFLMEKERIEPKKLSRAAIETLAIIAYHQPITRAEIEQVRGVTVSKGTLDVLMETGWVRLRGRRRTPGRPICYGTSQDFLEHFGLENIKDLPGLEELSSSGLLSANVPPGFSVPVPDDDDDSELDPVGEGEDDDIVAEEVVPEDEEQELLDEGEDSSNAAEMPEFLENEPEEDLTDNIDVAESDAD